VPEFTAQALNLMMRAPSNPMALESHEEIIQRAAEALLECGADRVRYYQVAHETVPELSSQNVMYLSWTSYPEATDSLGLSIELTRATVIKSIESGSMDPVLESSSSAHYDWISRLHLSGRTWVDIPVRNRAALVGVLCCDWRSVPFDLDPYQKAVLRMVGQLLGAQLASSQPLLSQSLQFQLQSLFANSRATPDILPDALSEFQRTCHIASISLFKYNWVDQSLQRVWHAPRLSRHAAEFQSETFAVNERLTGRAFTREKYRRVWNFSDLSEYAPELISNASVKYHSQLVGRVNSVVYARIPTRYGGFLVRAIDRLDNPSLPLITESSLLDSFALDLTPYVQAAEEADRTRELSNLQAGTSGDHEVEFSIDAAAHLLKSVEGIAAVGFAARRRESPRGTPHVLRHLRGDATEIREAVANSTLWSDALSRPGAVHVIRRQTSGAWRLVAGVTSADDRDVAVVGCRSGGTEGILAFGIGRTHAGLGIPAGSQEFLKQVCVALCDATEKAYVLGQAEGALRALSLVGHEMSEPMAAVKELSLRSIALAKAGQRDPDQAHDDEIELQSIEQRLRRQMEGLEAAMRLGVIVGRQLDGPIVGVRKPIAIASLLNFAIGRIHREISKGLLWNPGRRIRILRPTGSTEDTLVCDAALVEMALVNLYRNAVKYSIDTQEGAEVGTEVRHSSREGADFVQVCIVNRGSPIPPGMSDAIFDAFTRGGGEVDDVKRRGMGLGLYLGRRIARSHEGDAFLMSHRPLNSVNGPGALSETKFCLELRVGLSEGPYPEVEVSSEMEVSQ